MIVFSFCTYEEGGLNAPEGAGAQCGRDHLLRGTAPHPPFARSSGTFGFYKSKGGEPCCLAN